MAQVVGYFEDGVEYKEGPFVCTEIQGRLRVECEMIGHHCPTLPQTSIHKLIEKQYGIHPACLKPYQSMIVVDWLNRLFDDGIIKLDGTTYEFSGNYDSNYVGEPREVALKISIALAGLIDEASKGALPWDLYGALGDAKKLFRSYCEEKGK